MLVAVLGADAVAGGVPVRQMVSAREAAPVGVGPVAAMAARVQSAKKGAYFAQAQIAGILRASGAEEVAGAVNPAVLNPADSDGLKGGRYVTELEHAVKVIRAG